MIESGKDTTDRQAGLVSVVIPVYNRPGLLREACESVFEQTRDDWELLLVDDGSTDSTPDAIHEIQAQRPDRVRTVVIANGGPGVAREAGRKLVRGEFVQYLDSDDLLAPKKFELQVAALVDRPECDIAYGVTELVDEAGQVLESPYRGTGAVHDSLLPALLIERWWNTHTPLYRRSLCDRIGPWPAQRTAEDWHYDAIAASLDARLVYCDELVSRHRAHGQGRLTGQIDAAGVENTALAMAAVFEAARSSGVAPGSQELEFFARAVFLNARRADAHGLHGVANECLRISRDAAQAQRFRIYLYRALRLCLGAVRVGQRWS